MSLTYDLQYLSRSSVGASKYSLSVLPELFKPFMRYRGNNVQPDKWTGQPKSMTLLLTQSIGNGIIIWISLYIEIYSLTHSLCLWQLTMSLINLLHLLWSIASSLISCRIQQSFSTIVLLFFFGLPLRFYAPRLTINQSSLFTKYVHTISTYFVATM